ncbi:dentin sialophosphoproteinlike [Aplysia californica] [Elysia marginata]|uniref:Dentin sialophosphoproteinlike [Aplysia californica] n=1 Tax=Elysia marginata TaxID=1093978 RepID=A0AAV4GR82_9GAST|nr:dentin sialophosphoproteinlike [Aplysia californica] [Elysia marginata]
MQDQVVPTQKFGYIDVKQPAKVKARKLKSWRRRYAVLTLLNDLSRGGKPLAKLDLFESEEKWKRDSSNRVTFILENVTSIRGAHSRTHPFALEIVQRHPVLVLSGTTETNSYTWMLALQKMLVPSQVPRYEDSIQVRVLPDEDALRCGLSGEHTMYVTPQHIELVNASGVSTITWSLSTLKKFDQENDSVFTITCGQ